MSGDTTRSARIVGERYLHSLQTQTQFYRPDERGLVSAIHDCDAPTDIRLPHVSRLPLHRRLVTDYILSGRRVFFWLWRHPELVHCPYCLSNNVEPREVCHKNVIDVEETIVLVYRTYRCNDITHPDNGPKIFSTLNEDFRKRLCPGLQDTFPAVCPAADDLHGGQGGCLPSKRFNDLVVGFCGAPNRVGNFVGQINRFHFQRYLDMKNLYYCDQAKRNGLLGMGPQHGVGVQALLEAAQAIIPFPEYEDPAGWGGHPVTHQWLVTIYGQEVLGLETAIRQVADYPGVSDLRDASLPPQASSTFMLGSVPSLDVKEPSLAGFLAPPAESRLPLLIGDSGDLDLESLEGLHMPLPFGRGVSPSTFRSDPSPFRMGPSPFRGGPSPFRGDSPAARFPPRGPSTSHRGSWMPLKGKGRGGAGGTRECPRCWKETGVHVPFKGHKCPYKDPSTERVKRERTDD